MRISRKQDLVIPALKQYLSMAPSYVGKYPAWKQSVYDAVLKLDINTCTVAQFIAAKGDDSWIAHNCDECRKPFDTLVHIGDEPDYEARYQLLCSSCLGKAVVMLWDV